jgi:hypothetical protein
VIPASEEKTVAGVLCDTGIDALNTLLAPAMVAAGYQVALFTNTHEPARGDTLADYTEVAFGGYSRQALATPVDAGVTNGVARQSFAEVLFTPTGGGLPQMIRGYFVVGGGVLIGAELFAVVLIVAAVGKAIRVVPSITYQDRSLP